MILCLNITNNSGLGSPSRALSPSQVKKIIICCSISSSHSTPHVCSPTSGTWGWVVVKAEPHCDQIKSIHSEHSWIKALNTTKSLPRPGIIRSQGKAQLRLLLLCGYSWCDFLLLLTLAQPEGPGGRQVVPVLKQVKQTSSVTCQGSQE